MVHALACTIELWSTREAWRARRKLGQHERSIRVAREAIAEGNSSFLSALQTSQARAKKRKNSGEAICHQRELSRFGARLRMLNLIQLLSSASFDLRLRCLFLNLAIRVHKIYLSFFSSILYYESKLQGKSKCIFSFSAAYTYYFIFFLGTDYFPKIAQARNRIAWGHYIVTCGLSQHSRDYS